MSGIYVKNRKQGKRSVRTWYGCRDCGMYGDCTTPTADVADDLIALFDRGHNCQVEAVAR